MRAKISRPAVETTPISEVAQRMLAKWAVEGLVRPIPIREEFATAFDHPLIGRNGGNIANSADRVKLCPPERPCGVCRQRGVSRVG